LTLLPGSAWSALMNIDKLTYVFDVQATSFVELGSPFMAHICAAVADDIRAGGNSLMLLEPWGQASRRQMFDEATSIRLFGALHDLVLSGAAPELARHYPTDETPGDGAAAWRAATALIPERREALAAFMTHEPQTNEVRRSASLLGGFLEVARASGLPLRCFELGASAGLNQFWDRFHYDLGNGREWGNTGSAVRIAADWRGSAPDTNQTIRLVERAACDRRPVRLTDPMERRRLEAYVWPDQRGRLANLRAAIDLALAQAVNVEVADAPSWTRERAAPARGTATVVFHSIFFQYMPKESQVALVQALADHGAAATAEAPFAWVRLEPDMNDMRTIEMRLTLWPGGEDRLLAFSHPHGTWADWRA
jgi:hypothetical protein